MNPQVAILIDGGFFLKRYSSLYKGAESHSAETIAANICKAAMGHVPRGFDLYRIFYYDCYPLDKRVHNPVTKKSFDFSKTSIFKQRVELFDHLKSKRKFALRMGHVKAGGKWQIYSSKVKSLLRGEIGMQDITADEVFSSISMCYIRHPPNHSRTHLQSLDGDPV